MYSTSPAPTASPLVRTGQSYLEPQKKEFYTLSHELQVLKDQLMLRDETNAQLEQTILTVKTQLHAAQRESLRNFQEAEKVRRAVDRLKGDNKALEAQLEKVNAERRHYYSTIEDVKNLKRQLGEQMAAKSHAAEEAQVQRRACQRELAEVKRRCEDLAITLAEKEKENKQYSNELRKNLQTHLTNTSLITRLQTQINECNEQNQSLRDRVAELQQSNEDLEQKLEQYAQMSHLNEKSTERSRINRVESTVAQIQDFVKQVESLMDRKSDSKVSALRQQDEFKRQIDILHRVLI